MRILISGGGIAGSAAALFLSRQGHDVRVIDRVAGFQKRGYGLTLKSFGLKLVSELGLGPRVAEVSLQLDDLRVYRADGHLLKAYAREITERITHGHVFIRRSELHAALHEAGREASIPTRFGVHIDVIEQGPHHARVKLSDGTVEEVDLMVVAEGVRSTTRRLVWGDEGVRPFDVVYAAAMVHVDHGLDPHAVHGYLGDGQNVAFMPVGEHDLLIQCYWRAAGTAPLFGADSRARLVDAFRSFAPGVRRLLDAIPADGDVFCDSIAMVALPSLDRGRIVLLGDAGYCPTFLSGMGASLGLLGAKVLSVTLPRDAAGIEASLAQYGATMRPLVEHFQANALQNVGHALSAGHLSNVVRDWALHLLPPSLFVHHFRSQFDVEEKLLHGMV